MNVLIFHVFYKKLFNAASYEKFTGRLGLKCIFEEMSFLWYSGNVELMTGFIIDRHQFITSDIVLFDIRHIVLFDR